MDYNACIVNDSCIATLNSFFTTGCKKWQTNTNCQAVEAPDFRNVRGLLSGAISTHAEVDLYQKPKVEAKL